MRCGSRCGVVLCGPPAQAGADESELTLEALLAGLLARGAPPKSVLILAPDEDEVVEEENFNLFESLFGEKTPHRPESRRCKRVYYRRRRRPRRVSQRARARSLSLSLSLSRDVASRVAARARAYRVKATARELARRAAKAGVARVAVLRHGALFGSAGDAAFEDGLKRPSRRPNSWAQSRVSYS